MGSDRPPVFVAEIGVLLQILENLFDICKSEAARAAMTEAANEL